ncbi:MAG: DUF3575 domain-containing protein [Crocinitomicaceae bacterium]|nr:DUF3575 domain-containing protein [Crocinitomicaceae bacterium]
MNRYLTVVFFCLITGLSFGKSEEDYNHRNVFKFDGLRWLDYIHTTTSFSYERLIGDHFGVEASLGYIHPWMYINSKPDELSNNRGFMTSFEARYYFDGNDLFFEHIYIGVKGRYFNYNITQDFRYYLADSLALTTDFVSAMLRQDKEQYGIFATIGTQIEITEGFAMDFQGAIGFGRRSVVNHVPDGLPSDINGPNFGEAIRLHWSHHEGTWTPLLITLSVKFGLEW